MTETRVQYVAPLEREVLETRIHTLHAALNEAQVTATVKTIENEQLDAALSDEMARHEATRHQLDTAMAMMHTDRTGKEIAVQRYMQLEGLCRQLVDTYGNNSVDFHRAVALIRQHLEVGR